MDIVNQALGTEGNLSLKLVEGKLVATVEHMHKSGKVSVVIEENPEYFVSKLKALIPGQVDDMVWDLLLTALKAVK